MSPKPIQDPAPGEALVREYGLVGSLPLQLDETIVPVALVSTIQTDRWRDALARAGAGAVAAQNAETQLLNPAGSGIVVFCEKVLLSSDAAMEFDLGRYDTVLGAATGFIGWRNGRLPGIPRAEARLANQVGVLGSLLLTLEVDVASKSMELEVGMTLYPGQGLYNACRTVNQSIIASYYWRERNLLPSDPS